MRMIHFAALTAVVASTAVIPPSASARGRDVAVDMRQSRGSRPSYIVKERQNRVQQTSNEAFLLEVRRRDAGRRFTYGMQEHLNNGRGRENLTANPGISTRTNNHHVLSASTVRPDSFSERNYRPTLSTARANPGPNPLGNSFR